MRTQLFIIIIILFLSCRNRQISQTACNDIKQIVVTDKFSEIMPNKETVFIDSISLSHFCEEIKQLQIISTEPIIKVNFGFYLLDIFYKDGDEDHIEIWYTKFDGVVIRLDGKFYKNDELDAVMRGYLAPEEWRK